MLVAEGFLGGWGFVFLFLLIFYFLVFFRGGGWIFYTLGLELSGKA